MFTLESIKTNINNLDDVELSELFSYIAQSERVPPLLEYVLKHHST